MIENRSVPAATIISVLGYEDVAAASDWLCASFGFVERLRIGTHRAQLVYGDGAVIVTNRPTDQASTSPDTTTFSVHVRVADAESHCAQAQQHGARILQPPTDFPYGERQYTALDLGGYRWTFSQSIADVDPASWGATISSQE